LERFKLAKALAAASRLRAFFVLGIFALVASADAIPLGPKTSGLLGKDPEGERIGFIYP
jgi:hypothetical protein